MKKMVILLIMLIIPLSSAHPVHEWERHVYYRSITLYAPAVASANGSYFGVLTEINVTMMNGSGNVFVITSPLTQLDMQGSAKLAVDVAGMLTGKDVSKYDFLFQVKSDAPIVGGPSAGATMTIAVICLLEKLNARDDVIMTGMINPDGSVGPVGGILEKGEAAGKAGMKYFLIPRGQSIEYKTVEEKIGWITYYKKVPVNVTKELYDKYGLIVKEVDDINEALAYFTNYSFKEEKSTKPILTADYYKDIIKPMAEYAMEKANESYSLAQSMFEKANIPVGFPWNNPRGIVANSLDDAEKALEDSKIAYENAFYYYSLSKAFQSMINSRFVIYACNYYNGTSLNEIYNETKEAVTKALNTAKNSKVDGLISLQCVGGAQQRALDAEKYLNMSADSKLNYLYHWAYAMERSKTVYWWLNISKEFNESYKVNESWIKSIAEKYYDYAQSIFSYANILSEETGYSRQFVKKAEDLLAEANEQKEDYPASSLFNSLEAITNANLAIEFIGLESNDIFYKLNRTREMASYAIQKARNESIEPILAVSYFEFGRSLENDDVIKAITYYKYAYMIANMLCLAKGYKAKELVKNEINENGNSNTSNAILVDLKTAGMLGISFVIGLAIGWGIKRNGRKEEIVEKSQKYENEELENKN